MTKGGYLIGTYGMEGPLRSFAAALPPLPKPWMPDPKTLLQNAGRTLTFDRPLPRQWLCGAGEKPGPGEKNRRIGTYNNGELAFPGLLSTAGSDFGEMMADLRRVVWADRRLVFIDGRTLKIGRAHV